MQAYAKPAVWRVRTHNQVYLFSSSEPVGSLQNLHLVADGMGGHKAGDYASRFVVEYLISYIKQKGEASPVALLKEGISYVNGKLYQKSMGDLERSGMGTTLVAATVENDTLYVANVGDSRLYRYHQGTLRQVTRDHSYVEELVARGQITRGSKDYLENKHIITRAIGTGSWVAADFFEEPLEPGDLVLLCSDGLCNMLSEEEMTACLESGGTLRMKVDRLIREANENGGRDNIAVILVDPQISEVTVC